MTRIQTPDLDEQDELEEELELSLRPRRLSEFVGQSALREQLAVAIEAAAARGEALDHLLLAGPPGLGKTSLAQIVAERARRAVRADRGARPGAKGRHRGVPHRAGAPQRVLRRRDPPPAAHAGGDVLPRDGGPPPADHRRPGRRGARGDARSAPLHARRGDHPHAACSPPRCATASASRRASSPTRCRSS